MHAISESCSFVQASLEISVSEEFCYFNRVDPDEMSQNVTFHLCLNSLPKYLFTALKKG